MQTGQEGLNLSLLMSPVIQETGANYPPKKVSFVTRVWNITFKGLQQPTNKSKVVPLVCTMDPGCSLSLIILIPDMTALQVPVHSRIPGFGLHESLSSLQWQSCHYEERQKFHIEKLKGLYNVQQALLLLSQLHSVWKENSINFCSIFFEERILPPVITLPRLTLIESPEMLYSYDEV